MKNKWIITLLCLAMTILPISSFVLGSNLSKKKYSPKEIDGDIYIDYTDPDKPNMYLSIEPSLLKKTDNYIVLRAVRVRK